MAMTREWQEYSGQHKLKWRETEAGIEMEIRLSSGQIATKCFPWSVLQNDAEFLAALEGDSE